MATSIRNTTMLGSLSISVWEARKIDRTTARKAEVSANAKSGTISAQKHLLAGVKELKDIKDYAARVRVWWAQSTVPWFDSGPRAFNALKCMDIQVEVAAHQREFFDRVDTFMPRYPVARANAQFEMGDLFDPNEFPMSDQVRDKFRFSFSVDTVPNTADIRIIEGLADAAKLEKEITSRQDERLKAAMRDAGERLYKVVEGMHATMSVPIGDPGSRFHDSKLQNILDLVEIMPGLNLVNDPKLTEMTKLAKKLANKSPEELRNDEDKRAAAAKEAKALAAKLKGMFK